MEYSGYGANRSSMGNINLTVNPPTGLIGFTGSSTHREVNKPHLCDVCERSFPTPWKLKRHRVIHTGEKPYKCSICDKYFNVRDNLKVHMKQKHSGDYYQCGYCQQMFPTEHTLNQHMSVHPESETMQGQHM